MAAADVAQNNAPSPHSSANSSPQSQTSRLPPNTPLYTQEDVVRFVQAALAAAYRDHGIHSPPRQPSAQVRRAQEEHIMKPRIHMHETLGPKRMMVATLELPGLRKNDVSITARPNGDLVIAGERRPQHLFYLHNVLDGEKEAEENSDAQMIEGKGRTIFNELKFGRFQRVIRLPVGTDPSTITASMDDGMLTILWPLPSQYRPAERREHLDDDDDERSDGNVANAEPRHSNI